MKIIYAKIIIIDSCYMELYHNDFRSLCTQKFRFEYNCNPDIVLWIWQGVQLNTIYYNWSLGVETFQVVCRLRDNAGTFNSSLPISSW